MLSATLSDEIDAVFLAKFKEITDDDIKLAESVDINIIKKDPVKEEKVIRITHEPVIKINDLFSVFVPRDNSSMIVINSRKYPTVIHFNLVNLLAAIPSIETVEAAYKLILICPDIVAEKLSDFYTPEMVINKYVKEKEEYIRGHIQFLMEIALNKKFENIEFQNVLLATKNNSIIWNDNSAPILGTGEHNKGDNLVGKYLMEIRKRLQAERKDEKLDSITSEDITSILEKEPFLMQWLQMRVKDMCRSIILMRQYLRDKTDSNVVVLTPKFVSKVLDNIYYPCANFFTTISQVKSPIPDFLKNTIEKFPAFKLINKSVIQVIWVRIAVMLYYLISYLRKEEGYDIRKILSGVEQLVSKPDNCKNITQYIEDNCIISALLGLMKGISNFNKAMGINSTIGAELSFQIIELFLVANNTF